MINLIRFVLGYVKIKIYSENPEIILNKFIISGISIWSIERYNDYVVLCMAIKDYLNIRKIRSNTKSKNKIKVLQRYGIKNDIKKIKFRKSIAIGFSIVLAINIALSNFIWIVDVNGANKIKQEDIIKECEKIGINIGSFRKSINTYDAAQSLALSFDKIAWVSINIEGSRITVNITESEESEKHNDIASNIVASNDGVIKFIKDIKGTKCVEIGQTVKKGDILISGIETVGNNVRYVFSKGEVIAETRRQFETNINKNFCVNTFDGIIETRSVVEFFGLKMPLYLSNTSNKEKSFFYENNLKLFGVKMPIAIATRNFYVYKKQNTSLSKEDAINMAVSQFVKEIINGKITDVLEYELNIEESKRSYRVKLNARCLEDVVVVDNISIPND